MLKFDEFKKLLKSEFLNSKYIYGGGVDTASGNRRDWAHTTTTGADHVVETTGRPASAENDPDVGVYMCCG